MTCPVFFSSILRINRASCLLFKSNTEMELTTLGDITNDIVVLLVAKLSFITEFNQ